MLFSQKNDEKEQSEVEIIDVDNGSAAMKDSAAQNQNIEVLFIIALLVCFTYFHQENDSMTSREISDETRIKIQPKKTELDITQTKCQSKVT